MKRRKMRRLERRKRKGAKRRFNELSAEPINAKLWQCISWRRQLSRNWMEATTSFHKVH